MQPTQRFGFVVGRFPALVVLSVVAGFALVGCGRDEDSSPATASGGTKTLTLTQPAAFVETLPIYVAIEEGYFEEAGLEVQIKTASASGSAHVDAVLAGRAWGYIGGLEHVLFAREKGGELVGLTNLVPRATVYLAPGAKAGVSSGDAEALEGKAIATIAYGGTPNSILRWYLDSIGLDPESDVTLKEGSVDSIFGAMGSGQAALATVFDPILDIGKSEGLWTGPVVDFAGDQGPGPIGYTLIGVAESTLSDDEETVEAFLAAVQKGRDKMLSDPQLSSEVLADRVDLPPAVAQSIVERYFDGGYFSDNGEISEDELANAAEIVRAAGLYDGEISYDDAVAEAAP